MKKILLLLSFFFALGMVTTASAQCMGAKEASAGKSCCAKKAASAASTDATIKSQVSADGKVTYMREETDAEGNVRLVSVRYDEASNAFVNVAPNSTSASAPDGMVKKSCGTAKSGKACCAQGKAEGKACCAKKEQ